LDTSKERSFHSSGATASGAGTPKLTLPKIGDAAVASTAAVPPVQMDKAQQTQPPQSMDAEDPQRPKADTGGSIDFGKLDATPSAFQEIDGDTHEKILEGLSAAGKMSSLRREAAQSLRLFIFGAISDSKKALSPKDIDRIMRERIGTKAQISMLYAFWGKLDNDKSGSVDIKEFREFVDNAMRDIVDGQGRTRGGFSMQAFKDGSPQENAAFAQKMCDRVGTALLGKKSTFILEDMMRIIWPCSRNADLKIMKGWCNELELTTWRTATPMKLAKDDFEALAAVFRFFDNDGSGSVTVDELVHSGLMDKEQAYKYMQEADGPDGDGELSMVEFCELFCPTGYRAHSRARIGTDETGRKLVFDERIHGWRPEDMDPGKAGLFS
jgi:Ca2+-binding EF-hand superfamily protein